MTPGGSARGLARRGVRSAKKFVKDQLTPLGSLVAVDTDRAEFALTFDDGPAPGSTDVILEVLDRHAARATFFVLLSAVRRHPALLQEVVTAGHEIALHGIDHQALTTFPASVVAERQRRGKQELEQLTGAPIRFMRPPYGRQSLRTWRATKSAGLLPALWGPSTWDWKDISQQERVEHCLTELRSGQILLAHDAYAGPDDGVDDGPAPTIDRGELIDLVLEQATRSGLTATTLGALLEGGRPVLSAVFSR